MKRLIPKNTTKEKKTLGVCAIYDTKRRLAYVGGSKNIQRRISIYRQKDDFNEHPTKKPLPPCQILPRGTQANKKSKKEREGPQGRRPVQRLGRGQAEGPSQKEKPTAAKMLKISVPRRADLRAASSFASPDSSKPGHLYAPYYGG